MATRQGWHSSPLFFRSSESESPPSSSAVPCQRSRKATRQAAPLTCPALGMGYTHSLPCARPGILRDTLLALSLG